MTFITHNMQGSHASWKILEFLLENFHDLESPGKWPWSWKVLEVYLQGPGKSWNLLGSDVHGSCWFQIDMFMQTKIAIIVSIRYVFWLQVCQKCFHGWGFSRTPLAELTALSRLLSCCLLLYLNIAGSRQGPGKIFLGAWKVLEFFVTKRVGTLNMAS